MADNERLAALMREAGYLRDDGAVGRKVLARAVSRLYGRQLTHTYVSRWLAGMNPRDAKLRQSIAVAIGERLGRTVGVDELGFSVDQRVATDLGLAYPTTTSSATTALGQLWSGDLAQAHMLLSAPVNIGAWNDAALSWLVSGGSARDAASPRGEQVGAGDIASLRATMELFERMDGEHGGGHARTAYVEFLRTQLGPLLRGRYAEDVGQDLFRAAASATLLAAWMSYDAGIHGLGQRYFIHALKFADSAGDRLLGAGILDAMSHQATFLGRYREAANMASAALTGTMALNSATLKSHFYAMRARAHARLGDKSACDADMSSAVREFERRQPEQDPEWFQYFNEAELAAELGHCNRDLGRATHATEYAANSVGGNGEQVRSDFFATMVLADAYLDQGEDEQACDVALRALAIGEQLKSARCAVYVDEFRARLENLGENRVARDFVEQARTTRLWTPGSQL